MDNKTYYQVRSSSGSSHGFYTLKEAEDFVASRIAARRRPETYIIYKAVKRIGPAAPLFDSIDLEDYTEEELSAKKAVPEKLRKMRFTDDDEVE